VILVCGEAVLDMLRAPAGDRPGAPMFAATPGGSPANTAVALSRLGSETALCARLSSSSLGAILRDHLASNRVDLRYCVEAAEPASLAFVDLDTSGAAVYSFYVDGAADWQWSAGELPAALPASVQVLHTGSIAAARDPGRRAILDWIAREGLGRMVSYDPNVRTALVGPRESARPAVEEMVASADLVKASDEDVAWLYPDTPPGDVVRRWQDLGASVIVVTKGPAGAAGYVRDGEVRCAAVAVDVVDTVGAGDTFAAGLLHYLVRAELAGDVRDGRLTAGHLGEALRYAGAASSVTCSRAGADPPSGVEVDAVLAASSRRAPA